jgi:hypothetical protein
MPQVVVLYEIENYGRYRTRTYDFHRVSMGRPTSRVC